MLNSDLIREASGCHKYMQPLRGEEVNSGDTGCSSPQEVNCRWQRNSVESAGGPGWSSSVTEVGLAAKAQEKAF